MAGVIQACSMADVFKAVFAQVPEQMIAVADRGDEQIGKTVIIDVGKGGGDGNLVGQSDSSALRYVLEFPAAEVPIQPVCAELRGEIDIEQAVPIYICHGQPIAVIVMDWLVVLSGIVNRVVLKLDFAGGETVLETEVMESG